MEYANAQNSQKLLVISQMKSGVFQIIVNILSYSKLMDHVKTALKASTLMMTRHVTHGPNVILIITWRKMILVNHVHYLKYNHMMVRVACIMGKCNSHQVLIMVIYSVIKGKREGLMSTLQELMQVQNSEVDL